MEHDTQDYKERWDPYMKSFRPTILVKGDDFAWIVQDIQTGLYGLAKSENYIVIPLVCEEVEDASAFGLRTIWVGGQYITTDRDLYVNDYDKPILEEAAKRVGDNIRSQNFQRNMQHDIEEYERKHPKKYKICDDPEEWPFPIKPKPYQLSIFDDLKVEDANEDNGNKE